MRPVERHEPAVVFEEASPEQLIDKEKGKKFVLDFLNAKLEKKFQMTSESYRRHLKNSESLKRIFNKESYDKVDFRTIKLFQSGDTKRLRIKIDIYWFFEGYEGVQTFYFMLVHERDQWVLDWLIY